MIIILNGNKCITFVGRSKGKALIEMYLDTTEMYPGKAMHIRN